MRYLSFDIECCDGQHICEFGYVVIDEHFAVLERECIKINPEKPFQLLGKHGEDAITLAFSEEEYGESPLFPAVYDRIKALLEMPEQSIIGFAARNDVGFLATACARYELEAPVFKYLDFQRLYRSYTKSENDPSVGKMAADIGLADVRLHKSDEDAFVVLKTLQWIAEKEGLGMEETLAMLKKKNGRYKAEMAEVRILSVIERAKAGGAKAQKQFLAAFEESLAGKRIYPHPDFDGKQVAISADLQKTRYNEYLTLVRKLYQAGAHHTLNAVDCHILIDYTADGGEDGRLTAAKEAMARGRRITVMPLAIALEKLHITEEELGRFNNLTPRVLNRKSTPVVYSSGNAKSTLGDTLKARGIDLYQFCV